MFSGTDGQLRRAVAAALVSTAATVSVASPVGVAIHLGISACLRDHGKALRDN
jgi:hypothetical protein